jgi:hypothetical protein
MLPAGEGRRREKGEIGEREGRPPLPEPPHKTNLCAAPQPGNARHFRGNAAVILSFYPVHYTFTDFQRATEYPESVRSVSGLRNLTVPGVTRQSARNSQRHGKIQKALPVGKTRQILKETPKRGAFSGFPFANPGRGRMENVEAGVPRLLISPLV